MDPTSPFGDPDSQSATPTNGSLQPPSITVSSSAAIESPFQDEKSSAIRPVAEELDPLSASALARLPSNASLSVSRRIADEEPPASIMLDIDGTAAQQHPASSSSAPAKSSRPKKHKVSIFEQSRIEEEPEPSRSTRGSSSARNDDDADPEGLYSDEEAALIAHREKARGYNSSRRKGKSRATWRDDTTSGHREDSSSLDGHSSTGQRRKNRSWGWSSSLPSTSPRSRRMALGGLDGKQKALWMWANVDNMDAFLQEVYAYYVGKGAMCIALSRILNLL